MDRLQLQLLLDLHKHAVRQGPGGEAETKRALDLAGLDRSCRFWIDVFSQECRQPGFAITDYLAKLTKLNGRDPLQPSSPVSG